MGGDQGRAEASRRNSDEQIDNMHRITILTLNKRPGPSAGERKGVEGRGAEEQEVQNCDDGER